MKFIADMGVSQKTVNWLREKGHDALHLREVGLQRLPDEKIMEKALLEGRIILTMDWDFGSLLALSQSNLPSVIIFRLDDERAENVNRHLAQILPQTSARLLDGIIISVKENHFRIRKLPIS